MKKPRTLLTLTTAFAVLAVGGIALADHGPKQAEHRFQELDADANGKVTKTEFEAHRQGRFTKADRSGDGVVTREEFEAHLTKMKKERGSKLFERHDENRDGKITKDEAKKLPERLFARLDGNGDGSVTKDEANKVHRGPDPAKRWFEKLDSNGDGKVSKTEMLAKGPSFAELDDNGDGSLTVDEMKRKGPKHRGKGHGRKHGQGPA
jgi:Ca2+-binding EF-hand superfamily protein